MTSRHAPLAAALLALVLAGCLDPLVGDEPLPGHGVLPPGTAVPSILDDEALAAQVAEYDGVDGVVPRVGGFANGAPIRIWDFGPTPSFAAPVFMLVRRTAAGFERVAHNTIIEQLPGDPGYSPYWSMYFVVVTDQYQGEQVTSVAAIDEAVRRGLVEPPEAQDWAVNCPSVGAGVRLEVGGGNPPLAPPSNFYVKGRTAPYYDFGRMPLVDGVVVPAAHRYRLHREGGEPLSEPFRGVDLTGDGDTLDSNDVLDLPAGDPWPTPLCQRVEVAVPSTIASIDTSGDETVADLTTASQLFAPGPVTGTVIGFQITDELRNCAVQRLEGGL